MGNPTGIGYTTITTQEYERENVLEAWRLKRHKVEVIHETYRGEAPASEHEHTNTHLVSVSVQFEEYAVEEG